MMQGKSARTAAKSMVAPLLATLAIAPGCKEEPTVSKLFEEDGVWSLIDYDLAGDGETRPLSDRRSNTFMFKFTTAMSVVQTAACIFPGTAADPDPQTSPVNTPCGMFDDDTEWECRCFGYAFEEETMKWVEFSAGDTPPVVTLDPAPIGGADDGGSAGSGGGSGDDGGDDEGGDGGGGPMGETTINVSEISGLNLTFGFRPLPDGVFSSNGENSRYVMQTRGNNAFATALDDPMRPSCEPCI